jgi:hypothetical protein
MGADAGQLQADKDKQLEYAVARARPGSGFHEQSAWSKAAKWMPYRLVREE